MRPAPLGPKSRSVTPLRRRVRRQAAVPPKKAEARNLRAQNRVELQLRRALQVLRVERVNIEGGG